ncbi:MAG: acyl-CoA dehydrogenase family protein [Rhodobiaceae bacterium]|nr:acyl-CoA dehydrogenase family protein [Rhodobiaceae bacterium]MCC0056400.1 acyl-CoA dehydrogenase family protein [Rhodobiaceae bacterium]
MNLHNNIPTQDRQPAAKVRQQNSWIADDCSGENFYDIDRSVQALLPLYFNAEVLHHMEPHYRELGAIAGGELDAMSRMANHHVPVLHHRTAKGEDVDWVEFHPSYRRMEDIGYGQFGLAAMSHRPGVLGWQDRVPPIAKYVFQYLFAQSEFGLLCPISATDTISMLIDRFGDEKLKAKFLDRMWSQDMKEIYKGAIFMTEKAGGNDVSNLSLQARLEDGQWRLYGEKWFCSCVDADVQLIMARPEGAPDGNTGLALFIAPRNLDDGSRNAFRTVRLKDKMGTRSMASGEIVFEGAIAYPLGDVGAKANPGLSMVMKQVSLSRLSHGVRAAGMMRRCLNEALWAARGRQVFGGKIIEKPLVRRELMNIMIPTEQSLSMILAAATQLEASQAGIKRAEKLLRIMTPLLKYQASRDNIDTAVRAMEVRGGVGYINDWVNPRLINDAVVGVLWEGTSNINALDVVNRAIGRAQCHEELAEFLHSEISALSTLPQAFRDELNSYVDATIAFALEVYREQNDPLARQAAAALYHIVTATLMAIEGARLGQSGGDARRLLMSKFILENYLAPSNLLGRGAEAFNREATELLLDDAPVPLETVSGLLAMQRA